MPYWRWTYWSTRTVPQQHLRKLLQVLVRSHGRPATPCSFASSAPVRSRPVAAAAATMAPMSEHNKRLSVAVIGAGAAGLVAAREMRSEGHAVTVFEQGAHVGGVWQYTDETERGLNQSGPAGASKATVHSSMYASLRTNIPRQVMGYSDFPFCPDAMRGRSTDPRMYPSHREVQAYLEVFAEAFDLQSLVRFRTRVLSATPLWPAAANGAGPATNGGAGKRLWPAWEITTACEAAEGRQEGQETSITERYDALVVCNGHYSAPRIPPLPGQAAFPGLQMHSHDYRRPGEFAGMRVALLGANPSGEDISRDIAETADTVFLCARSWMVPDWAERRKAYGPRRNIFRRAAIVGFGPDGSLSLADGERLSHVDALVYCTGYHCTFPFLEQAGWISVEDNRVGPLWQHLLPPAAPTLSFIGLPWKVVPFPLFELQGRFHARALSGRAALPPREDMEAEVAAFYAQLESEGVAKRYTHLMGEGQWDYCAFLAASCGPDVPQLPAWRREMYTASRLNVRDFPEGYRDAPIDAGVAEAAKEAAALLRSKSALAVEA